MPEGPEIWRTADRLSEALVGREVTDIEFTFERLKKFENKLVHTTIKKVEARGKALITKFEDGMNIYSHNQLYGKWMIRKRGERPETNRRLRIAIHSGDHSALLYSATDIEVLTDNDLEKHDYLKKLGPDALHPQTEYEDLLSRFKNEEFANRKLATLLLDQSFISGIGNYLRSEILFYAGIDPDIKLRDCSEKEKEELAKASLKLSRRSYETGGVTTDPKIVEALKREGSERWNFRHFVYGRDEVRCHKCGTVISVSKTGGRKIFYCPNCQLSQFTG